MLDWLAWPEWYWWPLVIVLALAFWGAMLKDVK